MTIPLKTAMAMSDVQRAKMEQRLINFKILRLRCDCRMFDDLCFEVWDKCTAKNCPVWAKLMSPVWKKVK